MSERPLVIRCMCCQDRIKEDDLYRTYVGNEGLFCSQDCAMDYFGIQEVSDDYRDLIEIWGEEAEDWEVIDEL